MRKIPPNVGQLEILYREGLFIDSINRYNKGGIYISLYSLHPWRQWLQLVRLLLAFPRPCFTPSRFSDGAKKTKTAKGREGEERK